MTQKTEHKEKGLWIIQIINIFYSMCKLTKKI